MVKNIIFDLGGVLIDWNPRYLYREVFKSEEEMEYFLQYVCSPEWNSRLDAGLPFEQAVAERSQEFPHYSREIRLYHIEWEKMLKGEISPMVELFRRFRAQREFRIYALTNWSSETFPLAQRRFSFLGEFDGILVSGAEKMIKPNPKIFQLLLERFQLEAESCLYLDDNLENVRAATELGFLALHFHDAFTFKNQLRQLGLLSSTQIFASQPGK